MQKTQSLSQWTLLRLYTNIPQKEGSELYVEHTKHSMNRASDPNSLPQRNAKTYLEGEFFPFQREKLTEPQWEQKRLYLLLTSLWLKLRLISSTKAITNKPLIWKRYIDDIFSLWNTNKEAIDNFTELANSFHPTMKFTAEISDTEITFLGTCVYKGNR